MNTHEPPKESSMDEDAEKKALVLEYAELNLKDKTENATRIEEIRKMLNMSHDEIIDASAKYLVG